MRRPIHRALAGLILGIGVFACSREPAQLMRIQMAAPLSSATSDVVFVQVKAVQGEDVQAVTLEGNADSVTIELRVGEPATLTGTVFTFDALRWRGFTSFTTVTPQLGSSAIELTLIESPGINGTLVPTVTVHDAEEVVSGERLAITLHDVETGFTSSTPFFTGDAFAVPAGRAVVLSVPDRFSGGEAQRSLDTSSFRAATSITLGVDATIDIAGADIETLTDRFSTLGAVDLGLECAVDGSCDSATFVPCTADAVTLATERTYTVAVRYAKVPGSCDEARISRDLTPPSLTTTFSPLFVEPGLSQLTLAVEANEAIVADGVVVFSGDQSNRCTPTVVSPTRVDCVVSLAGLNLATDVVLGLDVSDLAGQHAIRNVRVHARDGAPVQVVGLRTVPNAPISNNGNMLVGITVAAFDGQPLCGIGPQPLTFEQPGEDPYVTYGEETWFGPDLVPAIAAGSANAATYWTRLSTYDLEYGTATVTGTIAVPRCGLRDTTSAPLSAEIGFADPPARWLSGGPLVISPLPGNGWTSTLPIVGLNDDVVSSDESVVQAIFGEGFRISGRKPGRSRLTTEPDFHPTPEGAVPASIDVDVVSPPEIVAIQEGRLVRRGRSSDSVVPLPTELGDTLRVFWESERELVIVVGSEGVWSQDRDGGTHVATSPCGASTVFDAALTGSSPVHASATPDVALLVRDSDGSPRHCELDALTLTTVVDAPLITTCSPLHKVGGDQLTGHFLAVGIGCVVQYDAAATTTTIIGNGVFESASLVEQMVLDARSATALLMSEGRVFGFGLTGPLTSYELALQRRGRSATFYPTTMAIDPASGVVWVAGGGNDPPSGASVYIAYPDRTGSDVGYFEAIRNDPNSRVPPSRMLFDTASHTIYSSRDGYDDSSVAASMLAIDTTYLGYGADIATSDFPIRAWPDGNNVIDMTMVGPQPIALSVEAASPGQRVTIIGSGFNGGGRDEVFVQGVAATVVASTRDSITFIVPPAFQAVLEERLYAPRVFVTVRSSGLLSGAVQLNGRSSANELVITPILPAMYIASSGSFATLCEDTSCVGGTTLINTRGPTGVLSIRPSDTTNGITRLETYDTSFNPTAQRWVNDGFALPISVPGMRRVIGVRGQNLVEQWPPTFDFSPLEEQQPAPQRARAIGVNATALTASRDGKLLVVGTSSGLTFRRASDLSPHPLGAVTTPAVARVAMSSNGLIVAATSTGELTAVRFSEAAATVVPLTVDANNCPAGARATTLALVPDAKGADIFAVTRYANGELAAEEIVDTGAGVSQRCRSHSPLSESIIDVVADSSGSRIVVLTTANSAIVYDSHDMHLPLDTQSVPGAPIGTMLTDPELELFFYGAMQYSLQPLYTP